MGRNVKMCPNSAQLDVSRAGVHLGLKHGNSSVSHTQPRRPEQTGRTITEQEVTIELPNYNPGTLCLNYYKTHKYTFTF